MSKEEEMVEEILGTFYIHYTLDNQDGDAKTVEVLSEIVTRHLNK